MFWLRRSRTWSLNDSTGVNIIILEVIVSGVQPELHAPCLSCPLEFLENSFDDMESVLTGERRMRSDQIQDKQRLERRRRREVPL
ncbi:hypothetical protein RRG08_038269 [Elysia crispata]|uniref:Uncharacterized protein n=1 Tax=Elysia crispata TaxID=231223 RepID=A0AAE1AN58_9GAST|nr:hypothetical protein RRG08_038269 [Elysia crispata]